MIEMLIKLSPSLWAGASTSFIIFIITLCISYPLSLLLSFLYNQTNKGVKSIFDFYITIERGTPLLLQLMFIYFGLPFVGLPLSRMSSVYVAFVLNYTAYFMEINRGGINSISKGQIEAAKVLGYNKWQIFSKVIMPQAFKITLPSVSNECLALIKDTSLVTVLGVSELLKVGRNAVNLYATALPFIYVGLIYLLMTSLCAVVLKKIESKFDYYKV